MTHKNKIAPHRDKETLASNIDIADDIESMRTEPDKMSGLDLRNQEALARRDRIVDLYEVNVQVDAAEDVHSDLTLSMAGTN